MNRRVCFHPHRTCVAARKLSHLYIEKTLFLQQQKKKNQINKNPEIIARELVDSLVRRDDAPGCFRAKSS